MFEIMKDQINHGFQMTFENGYTVSVRWGWGNYCDSQSGPSSNANASPTCDNCETAVFKPDGSFITKNEYRKMGIITHDIVFPYQSAEDVLKLMNSVSKLTIL